jgi:cytochrome c biogenesis protein CcmG, thiol:disulfide interchange protein DsbE
MSAARIAALCAIFSTTLFAAPPAPVDFTLNNLEGRAVKLSDYRGKVVVLDFWAMWCAGCKEAFPKLNAIKAEFEPKGAVVLGVNLENAKPEKIAEFVEKARMAYTILLDPKGEPTKLFGIKGVPTLVLVDAQGAVAKVFRGMNKQTEKDIKAELEKMTAALPPAGAAASDSAK